ncbi:MAG: AIPR family protein [Christensenellaceae bacterium]|jgi:hypothetical protein|nr:AIPR family protein [Christensenellaceae bacterium]
MPYKHKSDFEARTDLKKYDEDALMLYAFELGFLDSDDDIHEVAAECRTGGGGDKKCDFIYIDEDAKIALIAQAYLCQSIGKGAKANKASDLNTASAWVFKGDIGKFSKAIAQRVVALREAVASGKISQLYIWYVHNREESADVQAELDTVANTTRSTIKEAYRKEIKVIAEEVGDKKIERLWEQSKQTKIFVSDKIEIPMEADGITMKGAKWTAYQTSISGKQLHELYQQHGDGLFTANVRNYLGSAKRGDPINSKMLESAKDRSGDFWVFNNGITALVHNFEPTEGKLTLTGMSIINGAQTTGTIGSLLTAPDVNLKVSLRVIKCSDEKTVEDIIRYNNRQNATVDSDFRSNEVQQDRLRKAFEADHQDLFYSGGRRDFKKPDDKRILSPDTVAQTLTAFNGNPYDAYNNKRGIWKLNDLYADAFNENLTAEHIIFVYALGEAIDSYKHMLLGKSRLDEEEKQLEFLTKRGSRMLLLSAIAYALEVLINKRIGNKEKLKFKNKKNFEKYIELWTPIVVFAMKIIGTLEPALSSGSYKSREKVDEAHKNFCVMAGMGLSTFPGLLDDFADHVGE